jgi:hypothetical protein
MVSSYEQNLIADALRVAQITKLPAKTTADDLTWIEGVAKIRLSDASIGYGIVRRNPNLSVSYKYINGNTAAIANIEEVYPYESIDKRRIKKFGKDDDAEARVAYLKSLNLPYEINFENATISDLNKEVVKAALFMQLNSKED